MMRAGLPPIGGGSALVEALASLRACMTRCCIALASASGGADVADMCMRQDCDILDIGTSWD